MSHSLRLYVISNPLNQFVDFNGQTHNPNKQITRMHNNREYLTNDKFRQNYLKQSNHTNHIPQQTVIQFTESSQTITRSYRFMQNISVCNQISFM